MPLYHNIDKKYPQLPNVIDPQIKTVSIFKDDSKKIADPLLFQLSCLQTLPSSKNYVSIFPSFNTGLSEIGFLK